MKSLRVIVLVLCASSFAVAADSEFKGIVHSIEHTYGVHHMHIPLLGVAMFFARPSGVHGLKLAVFEGFKPPTDSEDVSRVIEKSLGPSWYPFVRVRTKGKTDGETTLIYASPNGKKMRMMIVSLEPSEAVVVKLELSEHSIEKWLKEPGEEADHRADHHHHHHDNEEAKSAPAALAFQP
jgi:hypothetical protein